VVSAVAQNIGEFGVVPIENSLQGSVTSTLDSLVNENIRIVGEILLTISHVLATDPSYEKITSIISHPQALSQCKLYINKHYPKAELLEAASTTDAVLKVAGGIYENAAAITSKRAAGKYQLKILDENIQDAENNITRFVILGKEIAKPTGDDKTSIAYGIINRPGILFETLRPFAVRKIDLTKIESRPASVVGKQKFGDYIFFLDFAGHIEDKKFSDALEELKELTSFLYILGSYPRAQ
jgi:chorismate mutase/prephenate dehydratase